MKGSNPYYSFETPEFAQEYFETKFAEIDVWGFRGERGSKKYEVFAGVLVDSVLQKNETPLELLIREMYGSNDVVNYADFNYIEEEDGLRTVEGKIKIREENERAIFKIYLVGNFFAIFKVSSSSKLLYSFNVKRFLSSFAIDNPSVKN